MFSVEEREKAGRQRKWICAPVCECERVWQYVCVLVKACAIHKTRDTDKGMQATCHGLSCHLPALWVWPLPLCLENNLEKRKRNIGKLHSEKQFALSAAPSREENWGKEGRMTKGLNLCLWIAEKKVKRRGKLYSAFVAEGETTQDWTWRVPNDFSYCWICLSLFDCFTRELSYIAFGGLAERDNKEWREDNRRAKGRRRKWVLRGKEERRRPNQRGARSGQGRGEEERRGAERI